jgi:hypothetical protein
MFEKSLWNPGKEPSKLGNPTIRTSPDMSGKGFWNPVRNLDMSDISGKYGLWIDFDDLHFTNSPNTSPLIVRSSCDSKK